MQQHLLDYIFTSIPYRDQKLLRIMTLGVKSTTAAGTKIISNAELAGRIGEQTNWGNSCVHVNSGCYYAMHDRLIAADLTRPVQLNEASARAASVCTVKETIDRKDSSGRLREIWTLGEVYVETSPI